MNCDATADELIDVIEGNRIYTPAVYALNKIDAITMEARPAAAAHPAAPPPPPNPRAAPPPPPLRALR